MSENGDRRHSDLIPKDHAEAMRRFEAVRTLDPAALANLEKQDLLLAWWSFFWLHPELHPDDATVWPEEVTNALPLAAEAFRRVFFAVAGTLTVALIAILLLEEKPLQTGVEQETR